MSLINQVLRDLDSRHAGEEQKALPNEVRPLPPVKTGRSGMKVLVAVVLLAMIAVGVWAAWDSLARPAAVPPPAVETPPPPLLVIAPPEPPLENLAAAPAEPAPQLTVTTPAAEKPHAASQVSSLQLATALRSPVTTTAASTVAASAPAVAPASTTPASIDKQIRIDAHQQAEAAYRKAAAEHRQGRSTEAIERLREALREEPGHGSARQLLLSLLVERQQWPEAEALLREGLELTPSHSPWAMALARIQVERGQTNHAWETLQKYMAAGEGNADYQGFAGVLLQRLQRPTEAVTHYEAALRLKPEARWWAGLGLALEAAGHANEAREAFRQAQATGGLTPEMAAVVERHLR
jgi:MSHA biogenesis protein MshN